VKFARTLSAIAALLITSQGVAAAELVPHTAQYRVKISIVSGELTTELRHSDTGFVAHHVVQATGMSRMLTRGAMDVTSAFSSDEDGVKPISYHAVDTIRDDPDIDLSFDWSTNRASGTVGTENVELQLEGISHDNVSIQYALMHDLLNNDLGGHYVLFDVDKMRVANVTNVGTKEVKTKAGTFTAIGIRHQNEGSSRTTTLWCVQELGYLPVIIEQHRKGKLNFRATLVSYTPTPE
jgi:hypothetical protein